MHIKIKSFAHTSLALVGLIIFAQPSHAGIPTADFLGQASSAATSLANQVVAEVQNRLGIEQTKEQKKQAADLAEAERVRAIKEGLGDALALQKACVDSVSSAAPSPAKNDLDTQIAVTGVNTRNFDANPNKVNDASITQTQEKFCSQVQVDQGICKADQLCTTAKQDQGLCVAGGNINVAALNGMALDMTNEAQAQAVIAAASNVTANAVTAPPTVRQMLQSRASVKRTESAQARSSVATVSFMEGQKSSMVLENQNELLQTLDMSNPSIKAIVDNHKGKLTQADAYKIAMATLSSSGSIAKEKGSNEAALQSIAASNRLIAKLLIELYDRSNVQAQTNAAILGTLTDILRVSESK